MFGSNNKKEAGKSKSGSSSASSNGHSLNSLVTGSSVEGTIRAESDLRIDGSIKGTLVCEARLIIGPSGYVEGDVQCQSAVIEGKFEGKLVVKELLNIRENATVNGNVYTSKLVVQPGAVFNVTCDMSNEHPTSASKTTNTINKKNQKLGESAKANSAG
ncbi:MAG: polymer-forming cytoskeletal protein [Saprospiraceae bacterium]|nr:polymer-forming cytoskeletal protein [Saprospiraceae bacterium]